VKVYQAIYKANESVVYSTGMWSSKEEVFERIEYDADVIMRNLSQMLSMPYGEHWTRFANAEMFALFYRCLSALQKGESVDEEKMYGPHVEVRMVEQDMTDSEWEEYEKTRENHIG